jgi:eukaryotic-like serine/threonine-protein kinase
MPDDSERPTIGGYELLGVIAQSCGETVYRARHVSLQRNVAIKVLEVRPRTPPASVTRFRREAQVLACLNHPNIVPIYEVGECAGRPYIVMKLIEGDSLRDHLPQFQQDSAESAWLLAAVARAVHHVHQRGFVHRNLHPNNVLLDPEGQPYLIGFSQVRPIRPDTENTQPEALAGAPPYMAPEQALGKSSLTPATDVYALGAIFYELLTGRPPFKGQTVLDTLLQVVERDPDPPRALNPDVDADLEVVCLKCLRKEAGQRYPSAEALADDLERWLKGEVI